MRRRPLTLALVAGFTLGVLLVNAKEFYHLYSSATGRMLANGNPVGGDFPCFYLAGEAFIQDRDALYDHLVSFEKQKELLGSEGKGLLPFVYPPLVAALFAPLATLDYVPAALTWLALSAALGALSLLMIHRGVQEERGAQILTALVAVSFIPFSVYTLAGGQLTALGIFTAASVYLAEKTGRIRLAGIALCGSYYKPPLFLFFVLLQLARGRLRLLYPFTIGAAALGVLSTVVIGPAGMWDWLRASLQYGHGVEVVPGFVHTPEQGSSLRSLLLTVLSTQTANLIYALVAAALFIAVRRVGKAAVLEHRFALDISVSCLLSPWFMHYDYALLIVPIALVMPGLVREPRGKSAVALSLALLYGSFLFAPHLTVAEKQLVTGPICLLLWVLSLLVLCRKSIAPPVEAGIAP